MVVRKNFLPGKSEFFSAGIENFCDRIHDPQTSNQIDAADRIKIQKRQAAGFGPSAVSEIVTALFAIEL